MGILIKLKFLLILIIYLLGLSFVSPLLCEEARKKSVFVVLPVGGWIKNEVEFTLPNNSTKQTLKDDGQLYGIYMVYANPKFALGSLGHYSQLDKTDENGYLVFANYYFGEEGEIQPTLGLAVEYIHFYTRLLTEDVPALTSLDVNTRILALHPTIGLSYKSSFAKRNIDFRISPFIGYFNERVDTSISSPGMDIAGQNLYGFQSESKVNLDYISLGLKLKIDLGHFIKLDNKLYFRFREGEESLYTLRNRIDFYFSKKVGFSAKIDYFQDEYETNFFIFLGPSFVF